MSPIDPRSLKRGSPLTILEDRECIGCGYNLKGIRADGVCPECGRKISAKRRDIPRYTDSLIHAPKLWLAGLALGSTMLFIAWVVMALAFILILAFPGDSKFAVAIFGVGAAAFWYLGVLITTQPRPVMPTTAIDPKKEWRGLRLSARVTQFFWLGVPGMLTVYWYQYKSGAAPAEEIIWGALGCFIVAAVGLIWLCVYLSNIAFWGDDEIGVRFRTCAWMIGAAAFLTVLDVVNMLTGAILVGGFIASLIHVLFMFFIVTPAFFLMYCLFHLQHMARWSLTNHAIADARTRRLQAQARKNAKRGPGAATSKVPERSAIPLADNSTVNPLNAAPTPAPLHPGDAVLPKKTGTGDGYDLDHA